SLKIIIEGEVVTDNIDDLPKAMCILYGLAYTLHLNYPKSVKNTFQFINSTSHHVIFVKPKMEDRLIIAPATSPLQYPITGFTVSPMQKSLIPGLVCGKGID
ncbi:hypothetical protein cypCar_00045947, partial [Cyprinus carpio]